MQYGKTLMAAGLLLSLTTLNAEATLTPYNPNGVDLVYSSVSNATWTKDANLLGTMMGTQGFNVIVNAIIAASPTVTHTPNYYSTDGVYNLSVGDFFNISSVYGQTNWFGAVAFTKYLNSINYAGTNQWSLPGVGANPQADYNQTGGQFGQLFYNELGGVAGGTIPNTANFANEQAASFYWLGTQYAPDPAAAWYFRKGFQNAASWENTFYAWAVSPGQVAAVPVPGAVWLMGTGLLGLLSLRHRRNVA